METTRLAVLIERAMGAMLTSKEADELHAYLADSQNKQRAEELLAEAWARFTPRRPVFTHAEGEEMLKHILEKHRAIESLEVGNKQWYTLGYRILAAASIVLVVATALYFFNRNVQGDTGLTLAEAVAHYQITPGKHQATITLADGHTITLDEANQGIIAEEAGMRIIKSDDGQISYEWLSNEVSPQIAYNTVTTPKGGHSKLVLPDGTKVHLNSESALRYPVQFTTGERVVVLEGEAYFEVVPQKLAIGKKIPFIVRAPTQDVEVLGTVFNVNAYPDEGIRTTLVEGKVRVSNSVAGSALLQPGEAALFIAGQENFIINKANLELDLAWHNGYFVFDNEGIESIMGRVARWYDVEVEYQGDMQRKRFGGIFQRSKSITQLLESFKATGLVDFKIAERRIIVMGK